MKKVSILMLAALAAAFLFALPTGASSTGGGPSVVMLDSLVDQYEAVRFDHGSHAAYFSGGCWDCHHQHINYKEQPCGGCHAIDSAQFKRSVTQTFIACRNCHGEFDPKSPAVPGLKVAYHKQCFGCHRGTGNVGKSPAGCVEKCHARRVQ